MAVWPTTPSAWNIFARELQEVLKTHGWRLGHLDDQGIVEFRSKVQRLQRSLDSHKHMSTLNPEEMDRLISKLDLSPAEQKRLRCALLATSVEITMLNRVDPETALHISQQVFELLSHSHEIPGIRSATPGFLDLVEESADETIVSRVELMLERADLLLSLPPTTPRRPLNALEALDILTHVLSDLTAYRASIEQELQARPPEPAQPTGLTWSDLQVEALGLQKKAHMLYASSHQESQGEGE